MINREKYRDICLKHIKTIRDRFQLDGRYIDEMEFKGDIFDSILWMLQDITYRLDEIEGRLDALDS